MARWIREVTRPEGSSAQWHALSAEKESAVANSMCGERFRSAVETASSDERIQRDGRCPARANAVAEREKETLAAVHRQLAADQRRVERSDAQLARPRLVSRHIGSRS